jgi:hypothetical protein
MWEFSTGEGRKMKGMMRGWSEWVLRRESVGKKRLRDKHI